MSDIFPRLSVVVPVYNESGNIRPLVEEIMAALKGQSDFEVIYVDDQSDDATPKELLDLAREFPLFRSFRHKIRSGQSAAIASGISRAQGSIIITLDGDGQNDPADIPNLIDAYERESKSGGVVLIAGHRAHRKDTWLKRLSSKIANGVRGRLLGDDTPDTGCGLKVFSRDAFLAMPHFNHMHRFLPALTIRSGGCVVSVVVNHRPRTRGTSSYGLFDRLWVGIADLRGVMWLNRRTLSAEIEE